MNERIRELAEQVGIGIWGDASFMLNPKDVLGSTTLEKFAELIVRECADYAFSDDQDHKAMLKHFGVEE